MHDLLKKTRRVPVLVAAIVIGGAGAIAYEAAPVAGSPAVQAPAFSDSAELSVRPAPVQSMPRAVRHSRAHEDAECVPCSLGGAP